MAPPKARRIDPRQVLLLLAALAGIVSFGVGWVDMGQCIIHWECQRLQLVMLSLPYAGLTLLFVAALLLGGQRYLRASLVVLVLAFLGSAALFAYDIINQRGQLRVGPDGDPFYFFWWWWTKPGPMPLL